MSKLPDNHVAVSALTGTKVPCRLLTKIRIFDAHKNGQKRGAGGAMLIASPLAIASSAARLMQQSCNDAPEVLNDGLINGDAALNGENAAVDDIHLQ